MVRLFAAISTARGLAGRFGEEEDDVDEVPRKWVEGERFFRLGRVGGRKDR